ncbi:tRNA (adenosine(37)-N6)-dimethylallyltransferase MiaA [Flavobacteriales bacterium]|nr:tRNA (adenosine(37)-N6)-dimethylallyltransferase MiaA [Flavobacteriales bacterium]
MKNKTLITIVGPTAIGKTAFSVKLAKEHKTEIISADSRQFFKEMSIGTAKPTKEEMDGIPHHFVDCLPIEEFYTAGKFEKDVIAKLEDLFKTHDTVVMTGGSGLYVNAVWSGIDEMPGSPEIRAELNTELKEHGLRFLQQKLKKLDYDHYRVMDKRNPQRVIRAIEVCLSSGKKYSELRFKKPKNRDFNIVKIGLTADRELMYDRINQRVDQMVENGLVEEVKALLPKRELNALNTVGYKELFSHFDEETTLEFAIEKIKQNTRNFAKRQLTWFKKDKETKWFDIDEMDKISDYISNSEEE